MNSAKRNYFVFFVFLLLVVVLGKVFFYHSAKSTQPTQVQKNVAREEVVTYESSTFDPNTDWKIKKHSKHSEIEGYASLSSVVAGQSIEFAVSSTTPEYTATLYRLGWYQGEGAAKVLTYNGTNASLQQIPKANPDTGLIDPHWAYELKLPIPSNFPGGMYFFKLTNAVGFESYVPFVVEYSQPQQHILLIHSVLTDQAYNEWGGNSLYRGNTPSLGISRAVAVSLLRPFKQYDGAGEFLEWEYPMVRWLEKNNYNVDYATDVDIHNHPELLKKYKLVMIVGHDEYWSKAMRDGYEAAVASGTNLAIFAANTAYRQVRIDGATLINYKNEYMHDPMYEKDNSVVTGSWRDAPVNRPESQLIGSSYGAEVDKAYPFVVSDSSSWIYQNSGLKNGDAIDSIVGYECDTVQPGLPIPQHLAILSSSPVHNKVMNKESNEGSNVANSNASMYTASSGAIVFNAGTIGWSSGLDSFRQMHPHVSHAEEVITKNILNQLGV